MPHRVSEPSAWLAQAFRDVLLEAAPARRADERLVDLELDAEVARLRMPSPQPGGESVRGAAVWIVVAQRAESDRVGCRIAAHRRQTPSCLRRLSYRKPMSALRTSPSSSGVKLCTATWTTRRPRATSPATAFSTVSPVRLPPLARMRCRSSFGRCFVKRDQIRRFVGARLASTNSRLQVTACTGRRQRAREVPRERQRTGIPAAMRGEHFFGAAEQLRVAARYPVAAVLASQQQLVAGRTRALMIPSPCSLLPTLRADHEQVAVVRVRTEEDGAEQAIDADAIVLGAIEPGCRAVGPRSRPTDPTER